MRNLKLFGRSIGVVYALYFATSIFSVVLASRAPNGSVHEAAIAIQLLSTVIYAVVAAMLYRLFLNGDPGPATVALVAALTGCAIQAYSIVAAMPALQHLALVFFAAFCLLVGYLILASRYMPSLFGWMMVAAGVGWLAFLVPSVATRAGGILEGFGFLAELALMLWLLVRGVSPASDRSSKT